MGVNHARELSRGGGVGPKITERGNYVVSVLSSISGMDVEIPGFRAET